MHLRKHSDSIPTKRIQHSTEAMNSIRHLRNVLIVATACCGTTAFAESEGERSLRLENERQLNEMNMQVMIRNREEDDARRARMQAQRNAVQAAERSPRSAESLSAQRNTETAERELGASVISYHSLQTLNRPFSADELGAISAQPVRLAKSPKLLPNAEFDQNALYRQGNVLQIVFTRALEGGKGSIGWRIYATCSGKVSKVAAASSHLANSKEASIKLARDPSYVGVNSRVEYFTIVDASAMAEVRSLCAKAHPAPFEMSVPIDVAGNSWSSVPVLSLQKASGEGRVSWAMTNHSTFFTETFAAKPAWDDSAAPIQKTVATSGSLSGISQWAADCRTGKKRSALVEVNDVLKAVNPSINPDDGRLMTSMPDHTRFGYEFACAALGHR